MGSTPSSRLRSKGGASGSPVKTEPFEHLIQHIKQNDPMLYEALKRLTSYVSNIVNQNITDLPSPFRQRTLLLKDTTIGNDIADHVTVYGGDGTCIKVQAVLRKVISSALTVRINVTFLNVTTVLGLFTVPSTTPINTTLEFKINNKLSDKSVFSWDVTASDGQIDVEGVGSFTVIWQ